MPKKAEEVTQKGTQQTGERKEKVSAKKKGVLRTKKAEVGNMMK